MLAADKAGIQAPGHRRIGRAFDNGPTIGEQGELVGSMPEPQDEIVMFDAAERLEAYGYFLEVHGPITLVDLN